ncbi:hypothetical protein V9T40_004183 [Parthenolecanium corni]|uniref:Uncharacterized protein n=1 Tax=Parthenolecanium corni TaxID=536013 RepID=A0AAN9TW58_9HEMI
MCLRDHVYVLLLEQHSSSHLFVVRWDSEIIQSIGQHIKTLTTAAKSTDMVVGSAKTSHHCLHTRALAVVALVPQSLVTVTEVVFLQPPYLHSSPSPRCHRTTHVNALPKSAVRPSATPNRRRFERQICREIFRLWARPRDYKNMYDDDDDDIRRSEIALITF